mgnify:CR=1 FL=1
MASTRDVITIPTKNRTAMPDMQSKKAMIREYKERKKPAGIFQIRNTVNGKILLGSSLNLEGKFNSHRFKLSIGRHPNTALQKDWNEYGPGSFEFEILDVVKDDGDHSRDAANDLAVLEQMWYEQLQPFGERGYNPPPRGPRGGTA